MKRVSAHLLVRVVVSLVFVGWLLARIELRQMVETLEQSHWRLFVLATVVLGGRVFLAGWRWQAILAVQHTHRSVLQLTYWYFVGSFFNMFLPTALGGDVVRMCQAGKSTGKGTEAVVSVMMERMVGAGGIVVLALAAVAASRDVFPPGTAAAVFATAACLLAIVVLVFHPRASRSAVTVLRWLRLDALGKQIHNGHELVCHLAGHHRALTYALFLTMLFHLVGVYCSYLTGLSLGIPVGFSYYCVAVPIVWALTMLPVSINGIGLREGGFVLLFTAAGVTPADAMLLSFLTFAQLAALGILGGILYLVYPFICRDVVGV